MDGVEINEIVNIFIENALVIFVELERMKNIRKIVTLSLIYTLNDRI